MKANPLLIAIIVLAVLGGAVYYTRQHPPGIDDSAVKIIDIDEDAVREVIVRKEDGTEIAVVRGEDGKWTFGGGLDIPADGSTIELMVTNLAKMDADRLVEDEVTDWAPYGLDGGGVLNVTMRAEGEEDKKVVFGRETPSGSGVFARLDGDQRLFTVYNYIKANFDKTVFDWRDKKLLRANRDKISRVKLQAGSRSFEFGRAGEDDWQILQPLPLRADNFNVGDLVRSIQNAEMLEVLAEGDEQEARKYSFARPHATVEIVDDAGAHTLVVAKSADGSYYAKSSGLPGGVYEVSSSFAESLEKDLADLRQKKLFDFGFSELSRIQVRDGETRAVVERKEGQWVLSSEGARELDSSKAQTLVDALRDLSAIAFPSDEASAKARFGLDNPVIEAEAVRAGADDPIEKVVLSDLEGVKVYAARAAEPSVYEIERSQAEALRNAIRELLAPEEESASEDGEAAGEEP